MIFLVKYIFWHFTCLDLKTAIETGKFYYKRDNTYEKYLNSKYFSFCHTCLIQIKYQEMYGSILGR